MHYYIIILYTTKNIIFRKCRFVHPIGQNDKAVCKNMVTMEPEMHVHEAQSAARSARPAIHREFTLSRLALGLGCSTASWL